MQLPGEPSPAVSVDGIPRPIDVRRPPGKSPRGHGRAGQLEVKSSGYAEFNRQSDESVEKDLLPTDSTAVPTTLLLLILVCRSGAVALPPLAVAGFSVVGASAILVVVAQFTSVSVFATTLTTALVLGLAVAHRAAPTGRADGRRQRPHPRHLRGDGVHPRPGNGAGNRHGRGGHAWSAGAHQKYGDPIGARSRGAPIRNETVISDPPRGHAETPSSLSSHRSEGVS
ncbi:MMPL family transporter [Streptomyces microflavus]|uniref:MMPL family transporter n=1 Tax=Streptomyces microflavus TaxID=1919 RepID=UPI0036A2B52E